MMAPEAAQATVAAMTQTVEKRWYEIARSAGVSEMDCASIAGAFVYPGFGAGAAD